MAILQKIVSGGQTGADRAALDTAIKFNISHGGWLPKGRKTEDGPLPEVYQLCEMDTPDYPARTRQNVLDASGTLIVTRGGISGGSKLTRTFAMTAGKPDCHIDLLSLDIFEAAIVLQSFIADHQIRILNVAGPRASRDPAIYHDVKSIIEAALYMFFLESDLEDGFSHSYPELTVREPLPGSLALAVDLMASDLSLREKAWVARLDWDRISDLYFSWLDQVKLRLALGGENTALLADLKDRALWDGYTPEDGVMDILKALKSRLELTHDLRVLP